MCKGLVDNDEKSQDSLHHPEIQVLVGRTHYVDTHTHTYKLSSKKKNKKKKGKMDECVGRRGPSWFVENGLEGVSEVGHGRRSLKAE